MAQATYGNFISDKLSKYAGSSRYAKNDLFSKFGLDPLMYQVTKYFYAASSTEVPDAFIFKSLSREAWIKESNWMGYVVVATDEGKVKLWRRDIVIAWRGTIQALEWVNDLEIHFVSPSKILGEEDDDAKVIKEIRRLVEEISITVVGHSLGAAISDRACLVTTFVFASPKVGDLDFKKVFSGLKDLRVLRIRNARDIVPKVPFIGYKNVGEKFAINTSKSEYLKSLGNLQVGITWRLTYTVLQDIALVNKTLDALKDKYLVPSSWWIEKNKDMVFQLMNLLKDYQFGALESLLEQLIEVQIKGRCSSVDSRELGPKVLADSGVAHHRGFDIGVVDSMLCNVILRGEVRKNVRMMWKALPMVVMWSLWNHRDECIFRDVAPSGEGVSDLIKILLGRWIQGCFMMLLSERGLVDIFVIIKSVLWFGGGVCFDDVVWCKFEKLVDFSFWCASFCCDGQYAPNQVLLFKSHAVTGECMVAVCWVYSSSEGNVLYLQRSGCILGVLFLVVLWFVCCQRFLGLFNLDIKIEEHSSASDAITAASSASSAAAHVSSASTSLTDHIQLQPQIYKLKPH
ncbi:hypothetical protein ACSBR1_014795 [Camellia fascicularis]